MQDSGPALPADVGGLGREQLLVKVLDAIQEAVIVLDRFARIIYVNPAYTRILGVQPAKVLGRQLQEIEPDSPVLAVLKTGEPLVDAHIRLESLDRDVIAHAAPFFVDGQVVGAVTIFQDVTAVFRLNEKLEQLRARYEEAEAASSRYLEELRTLRSRLLEGEVICESPAMRRCVEQALRVAAVDSTVLITGESGVGKEVLAKLIHKNSRRAGGPFVQINCGGIPEPLLESELFGYERGSFTGARREGKVGLFEVASGGTLFLDEVGDLPLGLQAKLLLAVEQKQVQRIGSTRPITVDVRIIAATNHELEAMVAARSFREDLFYRLNVIRIHIAPLRLRREDIAPLAVHFLQAIARAYGLERRFHPQTLADLEAHHWPGNARELKNVVERLAVLAPGPEIGPQDGMAQVPGGEAAGSPSPPVAAASLKEAVADLEQRLIAAALRESPSIRQAAARLGISHPTLLRKMRALGISAAGEAVQ